MHEAMNHLFVGLMRQLKNPRGRELNMEGPSAKRWDNDTKRIRGKNYEMRLIPTDFPFGATDILFYGNKLRIFCLTKDIFTIVIESEDIVKSFRTLYELAWIGAQHVSKTTKK